MSGNLWKYSHELDEGDADVLKKYFVTYSEGVEFYGLGLKPLTRTAREAGAVYKIGKMVRIRRDIFEAYLRQILKKEEGNV